MSYLTDDRIDTAELVRSTMRPSDGACIVFEGVVRDHHEGKAVESIFYDAYRPMAEKEIAKILDGVRSQFPTSPSLSSTGSAIFASATHRSRSSAHRRIGPRRMKHRGC